MDLTPWSSCNCNAYKETQLGTKKKNLTETNNPAAWTRKIPSDEIFSFNSWRGFCEKKKRTIQFHFRCVWNKAFYFICLLWAMLLECFLTFPLQCVSTLPYNLFFLFLMVFLYAITLSLSHSLYVHKTVLVLYYHYLKRANIENKSNFRQYIINHSYRSCTMVLHTKPYISL